MSAVLHSSTFREIYKCLSSPLSLVIANVSSSTFAWVAFPYLCSVSRERVPWFFLPSVVGSRLLHT